MNTSGGEHTDGVVVTQLPHSSDSTVLVVLSQIPPQVVLSHVRERVLMQSVHLLHSDHTPGQVKGAEGLGNIHG